MASDAVVGECIQMIAVLLNEEVKKGLERVVNNRNTIRRNVVFGWQLIPRRNRLAASETLLKELT